MFRITQKISKIAALVLFMFSGLSSKQAQAVEMYLPMVSLSWDRMLGPNIGLGIAGGSGFFFGMHGGYINANIPLTQRGISVSAGHYMTILGMLSTRNGVNWINLENGDLAGEYFGVEHSMTVASGWISDNYNPINFVGGYYRVGLLGGNEFKINGALGVGLF